MNLWKFAVNLFIGYLCCHWFNPDIASVNLSLTQWDNIWLYAWLLFWPLGLIYHFILWAGMVIAAIVGIIVVCVLVGSFFVWIKDNTPKTILRKNKWK